MTQKNHTRQLVRHSLHGSMATLLSRWSVSIFWLNFPVFCIILVTYWQKCSSKILLIAFFALVHFKNPTRRQTQVATSFLTVGILINKETVSREADHSFQCSFDDHNENHQRQKTRHQNQDTMTVSTSTQAKCLPGRHQYIAERARYHPDETGQRVLFLPGLKKIKILCFRRSEYGEKLTNTKKCDIVGAIRDVCYFAEEINVFSTWTGESLLLHITRCGIWNDPSWTILW